MKNTNQNGIKSVSSPSAQINKLCYPGTVDNGHKSDVLGVIEMNKTRLGHYYYLFMVMYHSGCRVSEALDIDYKDISDVQRVLIRAKKSGNDRVVTIHECTKFFMKAQMNRINPFVHCNRFSAYRHLKNLGIGKLKKGRTHASVTHIFRDSYVKDVRTTNADNKTTSQSIGHKSQKSTEYYGRD